MSKEMARVRSEYETRTAQLIGSDIYAPLNPAHLFTIQSRSRATLGFLKKYGFTSFPNYQVLEVGSGFGSILLEFVLNGFLPSNLYGVDLLFFRLSNSLRKMPHLALACADGQNLPFTDNYFNIVIQFGVFSSILVESIKKNMAREMIRVLRKNEGLILWYDFWINPFNPQTKGIRPTEIRQLFRGFKCNFHSITLAPPIARRVVPISWIFATILEKLRIFNSHYLVAIYQ